MHFFWGVLVLYDLNCTLWNFHELFVHLWGCIAVICNAHDFHATAHYGNSLWRKLSVCFGAQSTEIVPFLFNAGLCVTIHTIGRSDLPSMLFTFLMHTMKQQ